MGKFNGIVTVTTDVITQATKESYERCGKAFTGSINYMVIQYSDICIIELYSVIYTVRLTRRGAYTIIDFHVFLLTELQHSSIINYTINIMF